ncbi:hypothetical protein EJ03DRAFT_194201 [Teratosphaeria nubilosa]|uniref:Uncharacterized protein n=1 Tax=Teratosphaeria nubilosa TaxID=161662 RepID=A0A6G1L0A6_9PEZI|nr:hypothetical protein EJ03DRAFT_194201 [Teratosphaeria nubilosa]
MATDAATFQQQKPYVVTQLKGLLNDQLKEILRAYGKPVTGNKSNLQSRCIALLDEAAQQGDASLFNDIRHRAGNKGKPQPKEPADNHPTHGYTAPGSYASSHMAPGRPSAAAGQSRAPAGSRLMFRDSPFYELDEVITNQTALPEMPQNRNTVKVDISLSAEQCKKIADHGMRVLMYCGTTSGINPYSAIDVAFPNQIEVRINEDDVKSNYKGLKNKPGTTKPADLTSKLRVRPSYQNKLTITYALTTKRYAFVIYLAKHVSPAALAEKIKAGSIISKQKVLAEMHKINSDPDIEATSTRMSLKDPISIVRITLPVRGTVCTHNQCFDGRMFLEMMEQAPQWNCPTCNKTLSFQSLCVDKYFEEILKNTPASVEQVEVDPNGEWRIIKDENDDDKGKSGSAPRASYDDDFDDDLVEIDPTNKPVNGIKRESLQPTNSAHALAAFSTPPLSSREPSVAQSTASAARAGDRRGQSVTIDLTLSDDEDEPPRPAKRQATTSSTQNNTANSTNAVHTPASLPDVNRFPQHFPHRQADNYRQNNHRPLSPPQRNTLPPPHANGVNESSPRRPYTDSSGFASLTNQSWMSRPASASHQMGGFQSFSLPRQPPAPSPLGSASPLNGGFRLPPMQTHAPASPGQYQAPLSSGPSEHIFGSGSSFAGWRSDAPRGSSSYGDSPG